MNTLCTALILLARVAGGEVAIPAHQIAAVEDTAAGAIVTTERGAAWRVAGTARDVAERVRDGCLIQLHETQRVRKDAHD